MANNAGKTKKASIKPDLATLGGLLLAGGGILGGLVLEGGKLTDIAQVTALMIVLGGTLGAVMVTTPLKTLVPCRQVPQPCLRGAPQAPRIVEEIIRLRHQGAQEQHYFARVGSAENRRSVSAPKRISLSVDGTDLQELRKMMELEIASNTQRRGNRKVYEAAGGYAPTIGIIGAVLGLIQVMKHLENIEEVGRGIAVAFVATVYGVASANLFFLPAANKIKARIPPRHPNQGIDAGRSVQHRRRHKSETNSGKAGALPEDDPESPNKAEAPKQGGPCCRRSVDSPPL